MMNNAELQVVFEEFVRKQTEQSAETSFAQMLATPYGHVNGTLAATFHLFQFAYRLGAQNERGTRSV